LTSYLITSSILDNIGSSDNIDDKFPVSSPFAVKPMGMVNRFDIVACQVVTICVSKAGGTHSSSSLSFLQAVFPKINREHSSRLAKFLMRMDFIEIELKMWKI